MVFTVFEGKNDLKVLVIIDFSINVSILLVTYTDNNYVD